MMFLDVSDDMSHGKPESCHIFMCYGKKCVMSFGSACPFAHLLEKTQAMNSYLYSPLCSTCCSSLSDRLEYAGVTW